MTLIFRLSHPTVSLKTPFTVLRISPSLSSPNIDPAAINLCFVRQALGFQGF
jgi:hypothetical protein